MALLKPPQSSQSDGNNEQVQERIMLSWQMFSIQPEVNKLL
jgi:hypothetical protein